MGRSSQSLATYNGCMLPEDFSPQIKGTGEPKNAGKWMTVEMILVNPGTLVSG